jgi:hypothetical protein
VGAAASNGPVISSQGSDTNIDLNLTTKGTGAVVFSTGNGVVAKVVDRGTNTNTWIEFRGGLYGASSPVVGTGTTASPGTGYGLGIENSSQGSINFRTAPAIEQFRVAHTASAVNYVQVTGAATGGRVSLRPEGSDTNIGLTLSSKGTGTIDLRTSSLGINQLVVLHTASAVNYVTTTGSIASASPRISVDGSDTNIDLALTPKGTGRVTTAAAIVATGGISGGTF